MADNTGNYIDYSDVIAELYFSNSSKVSSSDLTLSNKAVDPGGDKYDFAGSPAPEVGDVLIRNGYHDEIIDITGSTALLLNVRSEDDTFDELLKYNSAITSE
jgi:hypothetical protein